MNNAFMRVPAHRFTGLAPDPLRGMDDPSALVVSRVVQVRRSLARIVNSLPPESVLYALILPPRSSRVRTLRASTGVSRGEAGGGGRRVGGVTDAAVIRIAVAASHDQIRVITRIDPLAIVIAFTKRVISEGILTAAATATPHADITGIVTVAVTGARRSPLTPSLMHVRMAAPTISIGRKTPYTRNPNPLGHPAP